MVFCNTLNSSRAVDHFLTENQISTVNYHGEVPAEERFVIFFTLFCLFYVLYDLWLLSYLRDMIIKCVESKTWTSSVMKRGIAQHWYALIWQLEAWTWMLTMSSCLTSHQIRYVALPVCSLCLHLLPSQCFLCSLCGCSCVFRLITFTEPVELRAWEPKV